MRRQKRIHVRKQRTDAGGLRGEPVEAQQRVQPEQTPAGLAEAIGLDLELVDAVAIEAVRDEQDHGVLTEDAPRPAQVEFREARRDPRAAGPVGNGFGHGAQRGVDIPMPQLAGDRREAGAEQEDVHTIAVVGHRMQEMQEHPRVLLHRPGHVAEHDKRRRAAPNRAATQGRDLAPRPQAGPKRRAEIDAGSVGRGPPAARRHLRERQSQAGN
jgi:hypothetical protein